MADWLKQVNRKVEKRPDVIVIHGVEGVGKSAFAAQFKEATFMMSENETGILKLMENGLVPDCGYFPQFTKWQDVKDATAEVARSPDRPKTLVIDTLNGIESLLHAHVCKTSYEGDMTKKGFLSYNEGPKACIPEWRTWLAQLDAVRAAGSTVVLLSHTMVGKRKNPEGTDYDQYVPQMHAETWSATHKFADMIIFMNFFVEVLDPGKKTEKAIGGTKRVYHFESTAAVVAKNRHGIVSKLEGSGSPKKDFDLFVSAFKAAKKEPEKVSA